jgi:hypothetical protein
LIKGEGWQRYSLSEENVTPSGIKTILWQKMHISGYYNEQQQEEEISPQQ